MSYSKELDQIIINSLNEAIEESELLLTDNIHEAVYYHDEIGFISGEFYHGVRGLDHKSLVINDNYNIIDIMKHGVLLVPERNAYIFDKSLEIFESVGLERLPLNSNHFVGYK